MQCACAILAISNGNDFRKKKMFLNKKCVFWFSLPCLFETFLILRKTERDTIKNLCYFLGATRWRSWMRHCATSRKVADSIPDNVIGIFNWHNHSGRTMNLRSTQPLTEMSTRNISWGKGGRFVGLTTLPPSCAIVLKSTSLILLEPWRPVQASNGIYLHFMLFLIKISTFIFMFFM
jgi:hypothetical protein